MPLILSIANLSKTYATGHVALNDVSLNIAQGEIFALLGHNGAGKTTLIAAVCGLVRLSDKARYRILASCGKTVMWTDIRSATATTA